MIQRTFVVYAQNTTTSIRTFRLRIENQPVGGRASFSQFPLPPYTAESEPPVTVLDVMVAPRSTIARNLFATSTDPYAQILVSVREAGEVGGAILEAGLQTTIVLNPDIANPDIANPDIANPDIANPDIANAEVHNPDIANPDIANPDISNPDIANPDIANPDVENVQVANPDIANPDIANPDIANPDIANPDIANPDIANPDIANQSLTDTTWTITNDGNTTSAFTIKLLLTDPNFTLDPSLVVVQLVLRKVYSTPAAINCELVVHSHNQLLANILSPRFTTVADLANPDIANPDIANPDIANATLWLAPGEEAKITLRTFDKNIHDDYTFVPAEQVVPVVIAQAVNTENLSDANPLPPVAVPDVLVAHFVDLPLAAVAGEPYGPVHVRVTDAQGTPIPGSTVQLELFQLPNTTTPLYVLNALTTVTGLAQFTTPPFPSAGTYRFRATAQMVGYPPAPVWSADVVVEPAADPNQHTVLNTNDSGAGSLRQAILDANASEGPDVIQFAIPGDAPHVIPLNSPLPAITGATFVNGPGEGAPSVVIDGVNLIAPATGLSLAGPDIHVRGLSIVRVGGPAIFIAVTASNARIAANYLGLLPDGAAAPNLHGIQSDAPSYLIGGDTASERNVISGNSGAGLLSQGDGATAARRVIGNYIGTTPDGTAARPNAGGGVQASSRLTIGGANAGEGNLISGNAIGGIGLSSDEAETSVIQGNFIGTNAAGMAAIPNQGPGIAIGDAEFCVIGGTTTGARNVISGNGGSGIQLTGDASAATIHGNYIGVNAAGTAVLGNGQFGVYVGQSFSTQIGGAAAGARNVISGNTGDGIHLADAVNSVIAGNYIGLDATGDVDLGNTQVGVRLAGGSYNNQIGTLDAGNVISGNNAHGVVLEADSDGNTVRSNLIGTDATGLLRRYNGSLNENLDVVGAGVLVQANPESVEIVGTLIVGNVISGNGTGVSVPGSARGTTIQGNIVGLTVNGNAALGNRFGVFVSGRDTLVGGPDDGLGNVVSGNTVEGIAVTGEGATNVRIQGNRVGTSQDGLQAIGNQFAGIRVGFGAPGVLIGGEGPAGNLISGNNNTGIDLSSVGTVVQNNRIGTSAALGPLGNAIHGIRITGTNSSVDGNVIAYNTGAGISFTGSGNALIENSIYDNGGLGIDGSAEGVTPNDGPGEADGVQNFPVITSVATSEGNTQIVGSLTSTPSTLFEIVFYVNPSCDPSGHGEGQTGFATGQFLTNVDGIASFNIGFGLGLTPGQVVTATARNLTTGDTSEFSACVTVTAATPSP
jgi:parallel beta-helix repeat protein